MAAVVVISGWPALPWGHTGCGPVPAMLDALDGHLLTLPCSRTLWMPSSDWTQRVHLCLGALASVLEMQPLLACRQMQPSAVLLPLALLRR